MIIFNLISIKEILQSLTKNTALNPLKILILFFSMSFISIVLDEIGFFKYLANQALKKANTSQTKLFFVLYGFIAILTVFTSNDIIILTFTPFIIFFAKSAKINPIPYLVSEFVSANTWSMMFIIGNPTNIYLATASNLDFISYFKIMFFPTVFAGITSLIVLYLLFKKELQKPLIVSCEEVIINNRFIMASGITCLGLCTIFLVISSIINLEMYIIALMFALILFLICLLYKIIHHENTVIKNSLKKLPYSLIIFVLSMFIIVLALEKAGITNKISSILTNKYPILTYGVISTLTCDLINNIPMSVFFSKIINLHNQGAIFSTIIGSNLGAYLTPIGALAGIMWLSILKKNDINYDFKKFIKYGVIVCVPSLIAALLTLTIFI